MGTSDEEISIQKVSGLILGGAEYVRAFVIEDNVVIDWNAPFSHLPRLPHLPHLLSRACPANPAYPAFDSCPAPNPQVC